LHACLYYSFVCWTFMINVSVILTLDFQSVEILYISDLQTILHTHFKRVFIICLRTKFHAPKYEV
jgi:hypothetical protein